MPIPADDRHLGLYAKFEPLQRTDGSSAEGGKHHGCVYFPLDLTHDPLARQAAHYYADLAVADGQHRLAADLLQQIARFERLANPDAPVAGIPVDLAEKAGAQAAAGAFPKPSPAISDLEERLRQIVCDSLGVDHAEVTLAADLTGDLGADSLDAVELVMAIEEELLDGGDIPDADAEGMRTFGDMLTYVRQRLASVEVAGGAP